MKKRITALASAFMLTAAVLAGCSTNSTASQDSSTDQSNTSAGSAASMQDSTKEEQDSGTSGEPYKVHFYNWTNTENMEPLLEAFNKEYEGLYEMVYEKLADGQVMTINTALASGEQVDVMTQPEALGLRTRAMSGNYLPLKQFIDNEGTSYAELFGDSAEQTQNYEGDYYSLPYCNNINMVFFNKKLFDEAGVDYPDPNWTWDDFRETAKKLTHGEGADKVYGAMMDIIGDDTYWKSIAIQKLGAFWMYNEDFTATNFDAPEIKESLQFFYDMIMGDQTVMPLDEYTALQLKTDSNAMNALYSDRFAMWIAPVYGCNYLNASYGDIPEGTDIGMTNFPRPVGAEESSSVCFTSTASIPSNVENPDASWAALKYVCIDNAELFAGPKKMHPGYAFENEEDAERFNDLIFSGIPGLDYDMCMDVMTLPRKLVSSDNPVVQGQIKIKEMLDANMSLVFNGEMSVDEALADAKEKGDEFIKADLE